MLATVLPERFSVLSRHARERSECKSEPLLLLSPSKPAAFRLETPLFEDSLNSIILQLLACSDKPFPLLVDDLPHVMDDKLCLKFLLLPAECEGLKCQTVEVSLQLEGLDPFV